MLVGNSEDSTLPTIYIGEGDPVLGRLKSHNLNKDFWNWAVVFTTTDNSLNKAHIQHLESRLVELAKDRKRCNLENGNQPQPPTLIESELADMESFLGYMLGVFPLIGIDIFESAKSTGKAKSKDMFSLKGRDGIFAKAVQNPSGFIVLKDSTAAPGTTPSISKSIKAFREDLIRQGVLLKNGELYTFTQDYTFSSPSMASSVTLGRNTNGQFHLERQERQIPTTWRRNPRIATRRMKRAHSGRHRASCCGKHNSLSRGTTICRKLSRNFFEPYPSTWIGLSRAFIVRPH